MWKEILPINCPPSTAKELQVEVYRILADKEPTAQDFLPYISLYPENERYKSLCEAYALSSFDSVQNALKAWKKAYSRGKVLGKYIARIEISHRHGKNQFKTTTGHFSTWLYDSIEYDTFESDNIEIINEN